MLLSPSTLSPDYSPAPCNCQISCNAEGKSHWPVGSIGFRVACIWIFDQSGANQLHASSAGYNHKKTCACLLRDVVPQNAS